MSMSLSLVPVVETHPSTVFFKTIHQGLDGVQELRTFAPDGDSPAANKLRKEAHRLRDFVPVKNGVCDPKRIQRFLDGCEKAKLGAFFGVALRAQASLKTKKGDGAHCQTLTCAFVDADHKHLGEDETIRRITASPLAPSMVVESGGGLHPYWILKQPFQLKNELATAKRWLRHIAASVADVVDETVSEPTRVLRIPGSYNFKKEYGEPRLVTLSLHTHIVYTLDQIRTAFGEPAEPAKAEADGFKVPTAIPKGDRHTLLYKFLRSQKARNVSLDVALAGCHALNEKQCEPPISHKDLEDYLTRVWDQADEPTFKKGEFTVNPSTGRVAPKNQENIWKALQQLGVLLWWDDFSNKPMIQHGASQVSYEDQQRVRLLSNIEETCKFIPPDGYFDRVISDLHGEPRYTLFASI